MLGERPEPAKLVLVIDVVLDYIKREVVESAKTPDRKTEQENEFEAGVLGHNQQCREDASEEKQTAFEVDQVFAFQVTHLGSILVESVAPVVPRKRNLFVDLAGWC